MTSVERKLLLVDLRDAQKHPNVKACPTCGSRPSDVVETVSTGADYVTRAMVERNRLNDEGWEFDVSHADTKRFLGVIDGSESMSDLVFVVALRRAS